MGEPLDNYDNVLEFLTLACDERGLNMSERSISLSTCGLADKVKMLADSGHHPTLSISLHAPNDGLRSQMMPINKAFCIDKVVGAARYYFEKTGRRVIFEYPLIKGKNDGDDCVEKLALLLRGFPTHVNVIRLNPVKGSRDISPDRTETEQFVEKLLERGLSATLRRSMGGDIEGACGQLRRKVLNGEKVTSNNGTNGGENKTANGNANGGDRL
jgi:23S rRNA (adenine2503-C2)-methyltransferase